jgi:hypothetical protein
VPVSSPLMAILCSLSVLSLISIAFLAVVVAIILTPGFPNVLLSLVASVFSPCLRLTVQSLWSLISLFFIFMVTNNRGFEHWICTRRFNMNQLTFASTFGL